MIYCKQDIKLTGIESLFVGSEVTFYKAKRFLEREGYRIISLEENARLRMQEGKDSDVFEFGNWVKEGVLYIPGKGAYLTKKSPIMANAKEATNCHRKGKEFYLTGKHFDETFEALKDSVKMSEKAIPLNRFGEDEVTVYAFGDIAKQYGEFLAETWSVMKEMSVHLAPLQDKPFATQLYFHGVPGSLSSLDGTARSLSNGFQYSRGIREYR